MEVAAVLERSLHNDPNEGRHSKRRGAGEGPESDRGNKSGAFFGPKK
jgi:hypothetical protein